MVFKYGVRMGGKIASNRFYPLHSKLFSSLLSPLSPLHLPLPSPRLDIKLVGRRPLLRVTVDLRRGTQRAVLASSLLPSPRLDIKLVGRRPLPRVTVDLRRGTQRAVLASFPLLDLSLYPPHLYSLPFPLYLSLSPLLDYIERRCLT